MAALLVGVSFRPAPVPADIAPFAADGLLSDAAFLDTHAATVTLLDAFLRAPPHRVRSLLSTYDAEDGRPASEVIVREAARAGLNPLVLLAKLQVEQSLVSRRDAPPRAFAFALGCGCPDGRKCAEKTRGFAAQVRCAADKLTAYFRELSTQGASRSLWRVGAPRKAACGRTVTPADRATASLYTYTPYVLEGRGGNWLFHHVFRRYAHYLGYYPESSPARARGRVAHRSTEDHLH